MAYKSDLPAAARRHLEAGNVLFKESRRDVAGYLYGIAAECAVKAMMLHDGMQPLSPDKRRDDPFFAHFPELRTILRDRQWGRRGAVLRRFVENDEFLNQWDTQMRYCKGSDIKEPWIQKWKTQAHDVVNCIGT